jgi:hypothetical protein
MLSVIEDKCKFTQARDKAFIVVQSSYGSGEFQKAFHELKEGTGARELAQGYAAEHGLSSSHINGSVEGPYPVNDEGISLDAVVSPDQNNPWLADHPKRQPKNYRVDIQLIKPFR